MAIGATARRRLTALTVGLTLAAGSGYVVAAAAADTTTAPSDQATSTSTETASSASTTETPITTTETTTAETAPVTTTTTTTTTETSPVTTTTATETSPVTTTTTTETSQVTTTHSPVTTTSSATTTPAPITTSSTASSSTNTTTTFSSATPEPDQTSSHTEPVAPQTPARHDPHGSTPSQRHSGQPAPQPLGNHDGTTSEPRHHRALPTPASSRPAAPVPEAAPTSPPDAQSAPFSPFTVPGIDTLSPLTVSIDQPPAFLIPIYKAAARRYHVPWTILAAINSIETDYGNNLSISSAGAIGWMQFMPDTWRMYGVDVSGGGRPNPYDPHDAIYAAAHYLAANGARTDLRQAIFAYNHAQWYVDEVLQRAQLIQEWQATPSVKDGYALPLAARYMHELGRTDDGVDVETAPDGAAVYSITPGVVTAVASDPAGFGPNYPVVLVTSGPLAGRSIYYGHVAASLVHVGQHVDAGQPIAVMGHTGDAASLGHGHIEIGFSDSGGDPIDHHGAEAWTPSGDAMRRLLVRLSALFGIANS
jgi:hypothetical protein